MSSYTWNSNRVLCYFERPETKLPRKLYLPVRMRQQKEDYYVRFDLMLLIQSVLKDLDISDKKRENMDIYTADSLRVEGHGYMATNWATMLGVPYFFEWNSKEDVRLEDIRHKWKHLIVTRFTDNTITLDNLNLSHDEVDELKETFVLSNNAKKFAIAQKLIEMGRLSDWLLFTSVPPSAVVLLNMLSCQTNDIFKMFERPWIVRYALYSVWASIAFCTCFLLFSQQLDDIDLEADKKLLILDRDYLEGGQEYYTKEMRRGQLLRKGLGEKGEELFHINGNLNRLFYEPDVAMTPNSLLTERVKKYNELLN